METIYLLIVYHTALKFPAPSAQWVQQCFFKTRASHKLRFVQLSLALCRNCYGDFKFT